MLFPPSRTWAVIVRNRCHQKKPKLMALHLRFDDVFRRTNIGNTAFEALYGFRARMERQGQHEGTLPYREMTPNKL